MGHSGCGSTFAHDGRRLTHPALGRKSGFRGSKHVQAGFDRWIKVRCLPYYEQVETRGQRPTPQGIYFRMLLAGDFEGIDTRGAFERLMQPVRQEIDGLLLREVFSGNRNLPSLCRPLYVQAVPLLLGRV